MASFITQEEVEKIARLSNITLSETEIIDTMKHLDTVLTYAARVQEIAKDIDIPSRKNNNIEREDVIVRTDSETILAQAPERMDNFFVVPVIIENQ